MLRVVSADESLPTLPSPVGRVWVISKTTVMSNVRLVVSHSGAWRPSSSRRTSRVCVGKVERHHHRRRQRESFSPRGEFELRDCTSRCSVIDVLSFVCKSNSFARIHDRLFEASRLGQPAPAT